MTSTKSFARRSAMIAAAAAATVVSMLAAPSAGAVGSSVAQSTAVGVTPSTATPNVTNGIVYAITKVGSQVILGGSFTAAQNQGSSTTVTRTNVLAFDSATGTLSTTFAPTLDGTVQAVAPGPTANTVYVGGFFKNINGAKARSIALLDTGTGALVPSFTPPDFNGAVQSFAASGGHLFVAGGFTLAGTVTRLGFASLNASTGKLDSFATVALQGHHNWNGGNGAKGAVGGRALAINPAGTRLVVVGNFKTANGLPRDQVAMLDIDGSSATVDPWATLKYTAACASGAFDTYVTDVQFAPDSSYFAITATGGGFGSKNSDNSPSLCDSAARWETSVSAPNAQPTWVDYTGNDTLWAVAISGSAIYVGGHQRWVNNPAGDDQAAAGAVPRPGMAALDPLNGLPLSWNPGRNPRGAGAYALLVTANGLYVGSDTDYFGNFYYKRQKIGFFPLAGGAAIASTSTAALPSKLYLGGPTQGQAGLTTAGLAYRDFDGTQVGADTAVPNSGLTWDAVRAAFVVGSTLFYGRTDGTMYQASFDGTTVGTSTTVDPYNDPAWSSVATGSGQTYRGALPGFYAEIQSVTGAFYSRGRLYYTLLGHRGLYSRYFTPDSGVVGSAEFVDTTPDLSSVSGMTAAGNTLYYARSTDGTLRSMPFINGVADQTKETIVSGPPQDGRDWRSNNLFLYNPVTQGSAGATLTTTAPTRVLDTRDGTGGCPVLGPYATCVLSLPAGLAPGAVAASLNVTVVAPTRVGYLTVFPGTGTAPAASNVNFVPGQTVPNLVLVGVVGGQVSLYNGSAGSVQVVADLTGYYVADSSGATLTTTAPTRVLDTRDGTGGCPVLGPYATCVLSLPAGLAPGAVAASLNVTVVAPTRVGYLTVFPGTGTAPAASNVNFVPGQTVPNLVLVGVVGGQVSLYNGSAGSVQVVADLTGYYVADSSGATLTTTAPTRVLDTRDGTGGCPVLGPYATCVLSLPAGLAPGAVAASLNVTVVAPTRVGYLTVFPGTGTAPAASNVNFVPGQTVPNLVLVGVVGGQVSLYNGSAGSVQVVADLTGYYVAS